MNSCDKNMAIIMHAVYSVLYADDLACSFISRRLEPFVVDMKEDTISKEVRPFIGRYNDKTTKKLLGALKNRTGDFYYDRKISQKKKTFNIHYNEYFDDVIGNRLEVIRSSFKDKLKRLNVRDSSYLSYVETARTLSEWAMYFCKKTCENIRKLGFDSKTLESYVLSDLNNVMNVFANHAYERIDFTVDFNNCKKPVTMLCEITKILTDKQHYKKAYIYAEKIEKTNNINYYEF